MGADPPPLSNAELLEWASNELRKYRAPDKSQKQVVAPAPKSNEQATKEKYIASANEDLQEGSRVRAIIAGQQAVSRDLPHLELTGDFRAAPAPQGGWTVRFSARPAGFASVPVQVVECLVAPNGNAAVRQGPDVTVRIQPQSEIPPRRGR